LLLGLGLSVMISSCGSPEQPPNVLLYVVDTLRADSLPVYGNPVVTTPAITQFANEAVVYERAYSHSSWTRPSIASILTGRLPDEHRVETRDDNAALGLVLLSEQFRAAGYATAAIITNPNVGAFFGFDQGYDEFVELFAETGEGPVPDDVSRARSDVVTQRALEWIDRAPEPFFLFVLTTDPHSPYKPPKGFRKYRGSNSSWPRGSGFRLPPYKRRYRALYWGEVSYNDVSFGELLDHLRGRGLYDRTVVALTSDHGEEFGDHGHLWHGKTLYEEQLRVPLIIRRPGEPHAGHRIATPVQLVDVAPTLLAAAGLDVPQQVTGVRLPPAEADARRAIFASLELDGHAGRAVLDLPWKLIVRSAQPEQEPRKLRGGLFDLMDDPFETKDLREARPEVADRLEAMLREREAHAARVPKPEKQLAQRELPDDVRAALEVLGYLERGTEGGGEAPADSVHQP
jgi:arylsulfatase A-like enzyme